MTVARPESVLGYVPIGKGAIISGCGTYRALLSRDLKPTRGATTCVFIMLNPSTADAETDDPTIRRCMGFARREHCSQLLVVNLFALRSPSTSDLLKAVDPIGPDADVPIDYALSCVESRSMKKAFPDVVHGKVICGWGAPFGPEWFRNLRRERISSVLKLADGWNVELLALGTTKHGAPRHPLYVRNDEPLVRLTDRVIDA